MLERPDLLALHEPLEGLAYLGPLEIGAHRFEQPQDLTAWLLDEATGAVFVKETLAPPVVRLVMEDHRFLREVRHTFLIRRPEEIAASFLALEGDLRITDSGVEALHELYLAVGQAGGWTPVVVDSDDLVAHPESTMRTYCDAVGLPFLAETLSWEPGVRPEWERTARWHQEASASTGFIRPVDRDRHSLAGHPEVEGFARRHQPFYERLWADRLIVDTAED